MNSQVHLLLNLFLANVPILYPLKTPENQRFLDFSGVNGNIGQKWVKFVFGLLISLSTMQARTRELSFQEKRREMFWKY